ncbi:MBL fold metallo-hydrolase [Reichenbachiella sp. MALMAid0571]|uniref:ComEC/Rec2 family competence protein n=1 Tax=Reichenbachiella sp. MALMAid0571 TaxID=3143939 RepID=UPI0032DF38D6
MKALAMGILLLLSVAMQAQYLESYRNTSLKKEPNSSSGQVLGSDIAKGDWLHLLDSGKQANGYYKVKIHGTNTKGWIYRSLVKRKQGKIPTFLKDFTGVEVTVIDVGAGLSCLIKLPDNRYFVYDGGRGYNAWRYITGVVDSSIPIEKLFLSHTDDDHWGSVAKLAESYQIKEALYTSYRTEPLPQYAEAGVAALKTEEGINRIDLKSHPLKPGHVLFSEGETRLTFVSGFGKLPEYWDLGSDHSKANNGVSIVLRLDYYDMSVLLTGDAVGLDDCKTNCDCPAECIATERFMLDSARNLLDVDVLIAAHHGAYNANCSDFIEATSPEYVAFSAGGMYRHPRKLTVDRFIEFGVDEQHIFRTDKGKKQKDGSKDCADEWDGWDSTDTGSDDSLDDHIKIQMSNRGRLIVDYLE